MFEIGRSSSGLFLIFVTPQPGSFISKGPWGLVFGRPIRGALKTARNKATGLGAPAAGPPPPGSPPQMGTSGSQRRGFRRTRAGAGGVPATVGGWGGVLVPQVSRSAFSNLRGWSGEPQKPVEIRWNGIGVGCGVGLVTAMYRPSVREDIRANALPPRIQIPV
jgi:hypothetical protein